MPLKVQFVRYPEAACIKLDGSLPTQDGIRHTDWQARRSLSDQPQRINEALSPQGPFMRMLHVTSLHTSRIGWESSIFGNQRNSSGLQIVSDFGDYEELCAEAVLARRESLFRVFACRRINVAPPMVSLPQSAMRESVGSSSVRWPKVGRPDCQPLA